MEQKNYGAMIQQMTEDQRRQQQHIDTLTAQMKPLAQTSSGQFALQDKLADQSAPKEERAAAAQALAPGFAVSVGQHGELSFSAAPMQDIGAPAGQSFEQGRVQANVDAGKTSTFMQNFDAVYTDIMQEKDPLKITEKSANLNAELANVINSKEATVRTRLAQSLGINTLEQQIEDSIAYDKQLYAANGMSYSGPTDETWQLINQRDQMSARMDSMVNDELGKDPEVANLRTRMGALDTLIKQKQSIHGKLLAEGTDTIGASIAPERVANARTALGVPDTPQANEEIKKGLMTNSGQYVAAERIASASPEALLNAAATGGVEGPMAERVLAEQLGDANLVVALREQVKNFDTSKMSPEDRAQYEVGALASMSPDKYAQAVQGIQQKKAQKVLDNFRAKNTELLEEGATKLGESGGWSIPTDPVLAEIPQVIKDIKTDDPKATITISKLISRMNWSEETKAAKIKALSNYIYAQAKTLPGAAVVGLPVGYRSQQEVEQMVQSKVVADRWALLRNAAYMSTGLGTIIEGVKGTYENGKTLLQYGTTPGLINAASDYFGGNNE